MHQWLGLDRTPWADADALSEFYLCVRSFAQVPALLFDTGALVTWRLAVRVHLDRAIRADRVHSHRQWRAWLEGGPVRGLRRQHRFLRTSGGWQAAAVDGGHASAPAAAAPSGALAAAWPPLSVTERFFKQEDYYFRYILFNI